MALNVISNFAANVAQRNLVKTDMAATNSLTKLSSGTRVNSAKDDAASLAIGSRLRAEVAAMKTASVNAGQAGSMLQIADGALATVSDILVRMKELAVQASSGQFSSVERGVLDSEFQALKNEITRISSDTEFNGTQLIAGGASTVTTQTADDFTDANHGISIAIDPAVVADNSAFRVSYDNVVAVAQSNTVTVAAVALNDVFTVKITDNTAGQTFTATFTAAAASEDNVSLGLTNAINDIVGVTVDAVDTGGASGDVVLTAKTAGQAFSVVVSVAGTGGTIANANTTPNVEAANNITLYELTTGNSVTVDATAIIDAVVSTAGTDLSGSETAAVNFASLGVTLTLDANFTRGSDVDTTGTATTANLVNAAFTTLTYTNDTDGLVTNDAITALLASSAFDVTDGTLDLTILGAGATTLTLEAAGILLGLDGAAPAGGAGAATVNLDDNVAHTVEIYVQTADGTNVQIGQVSAADFDGTVAVSTGTLTVDVGALLFGNTVAAGSSTSDFTFKVGTGNETYDSLTFSVTASSAEALGVNSVSINTAALAESASAAVSSAIDTLNQTRSDIGAAQNRLTFASANLATAIENAEAARSSLMDLDVAAEITQFTSKQVLLQTGISMLAQANQLPQNLLRLFQ